MNHVILIGRLAADPELRYAASSGRAVTNFRLAVNRAFSKERKADFFRVVVWGKQAENVAKYLKTGSQCAVEGSIQIEQYQDRDGNTRYSTDIVANYVEFLGSPSGQREESDSYSPSMPSDERDMDFPGVDDEDIPF